MSLRMPQYAPSRSWALNASTHWRLRSERTWLSITLSTRNRWRPQSWSGSGSSAIWPPASETSTVLHAFQAVSSPRLS